MCSEHKTMGNSLRVKMDKKIFEISFNKMNNGYMFCKSKRSWPFVCETTDFRQVLPGLSNSYCISKKENLSNILNDLSWASLMLCTCCRIWFIWNSSHFICPALWCFYGKLMVFETFTLTIPPHQTLPDPGRLSGPYDLLGGWIPYCAATVTLC